MFSSELFSFQGRASRSKFWLVFLLSIFVSFVVVLFSILALPALIFMGTFSPKLASIVSMLLYVLMIPMWWISIATSVKRFHDRNKSGWWYLIVLVPFIGGLWIIIENGFLKGTTGANHFGEDTLSNVAIPQAQGMVGVSSLTTPSSPSSGKLILLIIGGIILVALLGRLGWAYQQLKNDEARAVVKIPSVTIDKPMPGTYDETGFGSAGGRGGAIPTPSDAFVVTVGSSDPAVKPAVNQQKIIANSPTSKFTCGQSTIIGTNSDVYKTVQIGTQCWTKQDMVGGLYTWADALKLSSECNTSRCTVTTNQQGVCPSSWHVPTDMEFKTLRIFLGMSEADASQPIFGGTDQGTQLKVGGTSGFDAITDTGVKGFWTSSEDGATKAWGLSLFTDETTIGRGTNNKTHPTSVRCLKN